MKKSALFISLFLILFTTGLHAQDKKVAVITFYADKKIGMSELGLSQVSDLLKLEDDPNFNLTPILTSFHTQFFESYAKSFPFQLVPQADVINSAAYKAYVPDDRDPKGTAHRYTAIDGYKVIEYAEGMLNNKKDLAKLFEQYDGVMFVFVDFYFVKGFAVNGTGTVKIKAYSNIVLVNNKGERVFNIHETATSKKTGVMTAGIPVMKPEKVLPMCESALTELMEDLQKRIPKIIKKTEAKL